MKPSQPRKEITAAQALGILAARIEKRIIVLRAVGIQDGYNVAICELENVLRQLRKARDCFAADASHPVNR